MPFVQNGQSVRYSVANGNSLVVVTEGTVTVTQIGVGVISGSPAPLFGATAQGFGPFGSTTEISIAPVGDGADYFALQGSFTAPSVGGGTGDVSGPASAANGQIVVFSGTTGKSVVASTATATVAKITSGAVGAAIAGTDYADAIGNLSEITDISAFTGTELSRIRTGGVERSVKQSTMATFFGVQAALNAPSIAADMKYADVVSIVVDGALRDVNAVELKEFVQGFPWGIDRNGAVDATVVRQRKEDSLLVLDSGHKDVTFVTAATYTLQPTDANRVVLCYSTATTITVPTTFNGRSCTVMSAGAAASVVTQPATVLTVAPGSGATVTGTLTRTHTYKAIKITSTGTNTWTAATAEVTGGATLYLAAGSYLLGPGVRHPANNQHGSNMGATKLFAPNNAASVNADLAMMMNLARSNDGGDAANSWTPQDSHYSCFGNKGNQVNTFHGYLVQVGNKDPDYIDKPSYRASASKFTAVGFYQFNGRGVFSQADRQRLDASFLRSVGNNDNGIDILGNDPDVGQRCGVGSNAGHQVRAAAVSGLLVHGVNMFSGGSANRSDSCVALYCSKLNGMSICGNVLNDVAAFVSGDGPSDQSSSCGTTYCGPNNSVLSADGVTNGTTSAPLNAYLFVQGLRNIQLTNITCCPTSNGFTFQNLISAVADANAGANVSFDGTITTRPDAFATHFKNYASTNAVPVSVDAASTIAYNIRDIYTGAQYIGVAGASATKGVFLGGDLATTAPTGYKVALAGPMLFYTGPRLAAGSQLGFDAQSFTVTGQNRNINGNTQWANLNVTGSYAAESITLQASGTDAYTCDILLFGNTSSSIDVLTWVLPGGDSWSTGHVPPARYRGPRMMVRVGRRENGSWFLRDQIQRVQMTQAEFAAFSTPFEGMEVLIFDVGLSGVVLRYVNNAWRVPAPTSVIFDSALGATTTASTTQQFLKSIQIPASLLSGRRWRLRAAVSKSDTTDSIGLELRMNTSSGLVAGNSLFSNANALPANQRSGGYAWEFLSTTNTQVMKLGAGGGAASYDGTTSSTGSLQNLTAVPSLNAITFLNLLSTASGTTTTAQAGELELEILA